MCAIQEAFDKFPKSIVLKVAGSVRQYIYNVSGI